MTITTMYSIFATNSDFEKIEKMNENVNGDSKIQGGLKILNKFENEYVIYMVTCDASGNKTDVVKFKNKQVEEGFWGLRVETDDFDTIEKMLINHGYSMDDLVVENEWVKVGFFYSSNKQPNIALYKKK